MRIKTSLIGRKFSRLLVVSDGPDECVDKYGMRSSVCLCDCGKTHLVRNGNLKSGVVRSCGCLKKETMSRIHKTHGKYKTREYARWRGMISRCSNKNNIGYKHYGGRGITVCDRWKSFSNFLSDMGECPSGLTLERVNNQTGNYEPSNCVWATRKVQARNQRTNTIITVNGITGCMAQVCESFGKKYHTVYHRILRGWSIENAFTKPIIGRLK